MSKQNTNGVTGIVREVLADARDAMGSLDSSQNSGQAEEVQYAIAANLFSIAESLAALVSAVVRWEDYEDDDNESVEAHVVTHRWVS